MFRGEGLVALYQFVGSSCLFGMFGRYALQDGNFAIDHFEDFGGFTQRSAHYSPDRKRSARNDYPTTRFFFCHDFIIAI
jgi:hypothetical protein